ncbi:hypothetical protein [Dongia deserti]|uniref:hypothetical protein n=1 Tax=Dongia deserti TaxID=2268030 RepID=UPI000E651F37|nr:hypothetical protein [Dongia deserti]
MKLWDKLSSLIADEKSPKDERRDDQPQQAEQGTGDTADETGTAGPALSPAAANAVLSMLPKGQSLDQFSAGQLQLLNIESVRADLGDRWSKVEHQVHMLVEATLRRMLTESDIFTQISDYEYLVIFPNLTEQKASALMYVAAAQIRQKLFGYDAAFAEIRLNATVTRVGRDTLDTPPDAVTAIHEATLLGKPAQAGAAETSDEQPLSSPFTPWTDKYKILPVEGGRMTRGRMVADAQRAGGPTLDLSGLADRAQATTTETAGDAAREVGRALGKPLPPLGYPVALTTGADKTGVGLVQNPARPNRRLPDFSAVKEAHLHHATGGTPQSPSAKVQVQNESALQIDGYPVVPIKMAKRYGSYLVEGAPRPHGRMADFSSAHEAQSASDVKSPAPIGGGGVIVPALAARLDSLAGKPAQFKAVPITRPLGDQAAGSADSGYAASTAASDQGAQATPVEIEDLQLLYKPIWDVRRQAVTAYRMKVTLKVAGELLGLSEFCVTYDDPKLQATLNSVILRRLVGQIQQMRGEKKRAIIVAPINRRFIDDESGLRLVLDQLSLLSEQERQLVVLEIGDAYFGSWPTLAPRIALIHRVCRNVAIRLSLDQKDFQQVAATGANTVAGDLADHDWPERQTLSALNTFADGAAKALLRSSISGLNSSSMVIAAVCAGLGHLSGTAIGEGTPVPLGVYPLSTEGFYLQRQAQRLQQSQDK